MNDVAFSAFSDELSKTSGESGLWRKFTDIFRTEDSKVQRRVDYHFSPKAGGDKWNKLIKNVKSEKFVDELAKHPDADSKLIQHARSMGDLARGTTVGKIYSSRLPGRSYEIKSLGGGRLGCTCPDWRFKGSISPGYECKHIEAHKAGKVKASMSFADQTSSFADELSQILNVKQREREDELDIRNDRPYSSLLTRDEEPASDYNPQQADEAEPEVYTRGS